MTRKRWLIVLGAVTLALAITLLAIDPAREAEGNPSIVGFELAWDEQGAAEILDEWGEDGRDAARLSLRLDFLYLLAYGAFFALACNGMFWRSAMSGHPGDLMLALSLFLLLLSVHGLLLGLLLWRGVAKPLLALLLVTTAFAAHYMNSYSVYLDADMQTARERILAWLADEFESLTLVDTNKDPKTRLQEFLQSRSCELPRYEVVDIQGEPHCRTFFVECEVVLLNNKSRGQGVSRRIAEQVAAAAALIALGVENGND